MKEFDDFAGNGEAFFDFGSNGPLKAERRQILLADQIFEYPKCSRSDTINILHTMAAGLFAAKRQGMDPISNSVNDAALSAIANAINYLERDAGLEDVGL